MKINTGQGSISLFRLIAILSISSIISLPGLAISPILGDLHTIFPKVSDLEIQMLSSLPSLLIIPFMLLAGKLSVQKDKKRLLLIGLWLFLACGVASFFMRNIVGLIIVSSLIGCGAGIVIPLSKGFICDAFSGNYRVRQLGYSSGVNNMTLILASMLAGYLADIAWYYSFLVYTIPGIVIILSHFIHDDKNMIIAKCNSDTTEPIATTQTPTKTVQSKEANAQPATVAATSAPQPAIATEETVIGDYTSSQCTEHKSVVEGKLLEGIDKKKLGGLMLFYFFVTYSALVIPFYLPFVLEDHHMGSDVSGNMISLFFFAIMFPGFILSYLIKKWRQNSMFISLGLMAIGLLVIFISDIKFIIALGCLSVGFGYGIVQPAIYDKTARAAIPKKATLAIAIVLTCNYLAIVLCPFIIDAIKTIVHTTNNNIAFVINGIITLIVTYYAFRHRKSFVIGIDPQYYTKSDNI